MNVVKEIQRLNAREASLSTSHSQTGSWHEQYKDSAHIFAGGLPYNLTEGDVICVFSQFGEIAGINLVRDKDTGKSKGFAFIKYVDQRSTILAVDNLNSAQNYKVPKVFDADGNEIEPDEEMVNNAVPKPIQPEDSDEDASSESEVDDTGIDLDDPMREYLLKKRKKEAKKAKRKAEKEANHGGRSESKAERKARKEQRRAAKKDKEKATKEKMADKENAEEMGSRTKEQLEKDEDENKDKSKDRSKDYSSDMKGEDTEASPANNKTTVPTTSNASRKSRSRSPVSKRSSSPAYRNRSRSTDRYKSSSSSYQAESGGKPAITMLTKIDGTRAEKTAGRIGTVTALAEIDRDMLPLDDEVHLLTRVVEDMTAEHRGTLEVAVGAGAGAHADVDIAQIAAAMVGAEVLVDHDMSPVNILNKYLFDALH
ncbi:hypothetical protein EC968_008447, partial [Mortierella alpina]